ATTGTLTENRMQVVALRLADVELDAAATGAALPQSRSSENAQQARIAELLRVGVLCSNASIDVDQQGRLHSTGDPTEVALLEAALGKAVVQAALQERYPEIAEHSFDPDLKLMATLHRRPEGDLLVAVKGAPEAVIDRCSAERSPAGDVPLDHAGRARWLGYAESFGARGLRTLALATRVARDAGANPYEKLVLLGIVGLEDPPRSGVREALERCREAGITVVMVTGDHAATARNVGREVGLVGPDTAPDAFASGIEAERLLDAGESERLRSLRVLARVSPEQKLRLIDFYQREGAIVAMTGDGVNDAPALKKADIGVAMGLRGTAVAREAAAMVLQDDEFGTIVEAVAQGRTIFGNIRKFVVYLLSCNISEVLVVSLATLAGAPLPLMPLQILFLNLVTDVFPALALGVGEGSDAQMTRRPRPADEAVLTRRHWIRIALHGLVISGSVLAAMAMAILYLGFDTQRAVTVSFCTLALAQLWHVFNMRDDMASPVRNEITRNGWVWAALVLCLALVLGSIYTPLPAALLRLSDPGPEGWVLVLAMSALPLVAGPFVRVFARRYADSRS
ncbi:MAG: HAD-IC family P-type ATPase, partial [Gammaproteobacteria bacterium]|nr:HAD-IC family P-type ATPase [Gammaproteobacteria bacterium]